MKPATATEFVIVGAVLGAPVGFLGLLLFLVLFGSGLSGSGFTELRQIISYRPLAGAALGSTVGAAVGYAVARATRKPRGPDEPPK